MRKSHRKGKIKPLTDQMKQAAQLMFDGEKTGHIAALMGVHRTTIWRWYKRKDFQREIVRIHDKYVRQKRKEIMRQIRESPEHKRELAARRRLSTLERKLEDAGNSGNMNAYRKAAAAYDKCFNEAYGACLNAFCDMFNSQKYTRAKKTSKPKQYKVIIID